MKTKIIVLLAAGIFFSTLAMAAKTPVKKPESFSERLRSEITYPQTAFQNKVEGMVLVGFTVDEKGNIKINGVNASNKELCDHVVRILGKTKALPSDMVYGKSFNMKFVFRLV
jgi:TonB family protein